MITLSSAFAPPVALGPVYAFVWFAIVGVPKGASVVGKDTPDGGPPAGAKGLLGDPAADGIMVTGEDPWAV